ncbi:hypothetical protein K438DRAFT_940587 [Mycena galopus ATCC 62051]|nr:hypothetical protein K438DRAFT_940587 [Mycena galopus ATCC 62051]
MSLRLYSWGADGEGGDAGHGHDFVAHFLHDRGAGRGRGRGWGENAAVTAHRSQGHTATSAGRRPRWAQAMGMGIHLDYRCIFTRTPTPACSPLPRSPAFPVFSSFNSFMYAPLPAPLRRFPVFVLGTSLSLCPCPRSLAARCDVLTSGTCPSSFPPHMADADREGEARIRDILITRRAGPGARANGGGRMRAGSSAVPYLLDAQVRARSSLRWVTVGGVCLARAQRWAALLAGADTGTGAERGRAERGRRRARRRGGSGGRQRRRSVSERGWRVRARLSRTNCASSSLSSPTPSPSPPRSRHAAQEVSVEGYWYSSEGSDRVITPCHHLPTPAMGRTLPTRTSEALGTTPGPGYDS